MYIDRKLIKPGQRWLWNDGERFVVEILRLRGDRVFCKIVQVISSSWRIIDQEADWGFNSTAWSYLEGQDKVNET